eukprot:TCALIF_09477-PA protein Name:"Similar to TAF15 Transcription initiation factor TFIID subunit 15 (Arabidopsis thaliana)" AED:0.40 eAED:0.76 QI:0/0/0/1/1/1/2/0/211
MGFRKAKEGDPRVNSEVQIFVENLPKTVTVPELNTFFEKAGKVKKDRDTRQPRVWLYHDKTTNEPTGECTITYYNHESQVKALKEFNQAMFQGQTITVTPSIVKFHMARVPPRRAKEAARGRGGSVGHRGRGKPRSDGGSNFATPRIGGFGTRGQSSDRRRSGLEAPSREDLLVHEAKSHEMTRFEELHGGVRECRAGSAPSSNGKERIRK